MSSISVDIIFYIMYFKIFTMEIYCTCNENYHDVYKKALADGEGGRGA